MTPPMSRPGVIRLDGSTRNPGFTHSPVDYGEDPMIGRGRNTFQVVVNGISEPATVGDGNG